MLLSNRIAIVTGATRGIGRATLERFAAEGATVVGVYVHNDDLAARIEADMAQQGHSVRFYKGSVHDRAFVRQLMKQVKEQYGRIDLLVNNAGITQDNLAIMMSAEEWDSVFRTNYVGTHCCCMEAIPYMVEQQYGKVVNVVSVSGVYGREAQTNYAASKGAIIGLTRLLARRYATAGILCNAIAPGMIETEMSDQVPPEKMDNFLRHTHVNRQGTAAEIAASIVYLASELSDYVSGQVLKADGGFMH